jgi:DNA replication and repair protein RecF
VGFTFLKTVSFRNLSDSETNITGKDIFLVGKNGQGKTNFLEALYFCSYASSFRGVRDKEVAKTGDKDFSVIAGLSNSLYSTVNVFFSIF